MKDFITHTKISMNKLYKKLRDIKHNMGWKMLCNLFNLLFSVLGHGLGAALATHAVAHLIKAGVKITLLETYGSPRVGNKEFSAWYQTIYPNVLKPRVTHGRDPVVHLPPEDLGFRHIQTEIFYQGSVSQGYKICNDERAEDKNCSDQYYADVNYIDHGTYYDIDFNGIILTC